MKFGRAIKHLTNFRPTKLKLLLSIKILCASHFKSVRKYAPLELKHLHLRIFSFIFYIISTQIIDVNQKLNILSRFGMLKAISNLFCSFSYTLYIPTSFPGPISLFVIGKAGNGPGTGRFVLQSKRSLYFGDFSMIRVVEIISIISPRNGRREKGTKSDSKKALCPTI